MSDHSDTVRVRIWRTGDLDDRVSPESIKAHNDRRAAVEEVLTDTTIFKVKDWDEARLKDKEAHELVGIIVEFVKDPNVQQAALNTAQQAAQWAGGIILSAAAAELTKQAAIGVKTLALKLWTKVKEVKIRNFNISTGDRQQFLLLSSDDMKEAAEK